jgi:hypothetical protein
VGFVPAVDDSEPAAPVRRAADVVDVFVYVVVLNLFIEYFPAVISESFTLSLLTAVLLKTVDLVFGDNVSLGGFVSVTLLIVALLVSRLAVRRLRAPAPHDVSAAGGRSPGR